MIRDTVPELEYHHIQDSLPYSRWSCYRQKMYYIEFCLLVSREVAIPVSLVGYAKCRGHIR